MLCGKGIVGGVQTRLRFLHSRIRVIVQLLLDKLVDDLPQLHHASDTGFGCIGQLDLGHNRIFAVVHLAVHHSIAEILHIRVRREGLTFRFCIRNIWCFYLDFRIMPLNMLYRFGKLFG
jgi:hypothetical protein